jgi:hypothetical protein
MVPLGLSQPVSVKGVRFERCARGLLSHGRVECPGGQTEVESYGRTGRLSLSRGGC